MWCGEKDEVPVDQRGIPRPNSLRKTAASESAKLCFVLHFGTWCWHSSECRCILANLTWPVNLNPLPFSFWFGRWLSSLWRARQSVLVAIWPIIWLRNRRLQTMSSVPDLPLMLLSYILIYSLKLSRGLFPFTFQRWACDTTSYDSKSTNLSDRHHICQLIILSIEYTKQTYCMSSNTMSSNSIYQTSFLTPPFNRYRVGTRGVVIDEVPILFHIIPWGGVLVERINNIFFENSCALFHRLTHDRVSFWFSEIFYLPEDYHIIWLCLCDRIFISLFLL